MSWGPELVPALSVPFSHADAVPVCRVQEETDLGLLLEIATNFKLDCLGWLLRN